MCVKGHVLASYETVHPNLGGCKRARVFIERKKRIPVRMVNIFGHP